METDPWLERKTAPACDPPGGGDVEDLGFIRTVQLTDPDGNTFTFVEETPEA